MMDYTAWNFTQEDNFCRLTIDRGAHSLVSRVFGWNGAPVEIEAPGGTKQPLEATLSLEPW